MTARTLPIARMVVALRAIGGPREVDVVQLREGAAVRVRRPVGFTGLSPALLWIHGGCYFVGCAAQDDKLCQRFARALGVVVASVEYRVAPENPYPAALDDCETALNWLLAQPDVDSSRVAIGGASAGGGLTAALALRLRDQKARQPAMQLLTYPMLDDRPAVLRKPMRRIARGASLTRPPRQSWPAPRLPRRPPLPDRGEMLEARKRRHIRQAADSTVLRPARDEMVAALESFVRSRIDHVHTLDSLAGWCGVSPRTLARRTSRAVGLSPIQLVQRVRLERSLHLLRTTRMPLEDVAAAVGLADPATLHRLVKRHTGRSPGALRPNAAPRAS